MTFGSRFMPSAVSYATGFLCLGVCYYIFGHAFVTITDNVIFCYKVDEYYNKASERAVLYSDPTFGIDWGVKDPILSDKDLKNPLFKDSGVDFTYRGK